MTAQQPNLLLEAALGYARAGWPVFPLSPGGKQPLPGSRGFYEATTDEAVIRGWWARVPAANVGVATGPGSGWVLDLDGPEAADALLELERQHGALPPAPEVWTPRPGRHLWWAWPADGEVRNRAGVAPGIDVRGERGYVVVPPSIRSDRDGAVYAWDGSTPDPFGALPQAPDWLLRLVRSSKQQPAGEPQTAGPAQPAAGRGPIRSPARYLEGAIKRASQNIVSAAVGTRNHTLNRESFGALAAAASVAAVVPGALEQATAALEQAAAASGLPVEEARRTMQSARAAAEREPLRLVSPVADPDSEQQAQDPRTVIRLRTQELPEAANQLAVALAKLGSVYVHGERVVRTGDTDTLPQPDRTRRAPGALKLYPLTTPAALRYSADQAALFWAYDKRTGQDQPTNAPNPLLESFLSKPGWPELPVLEQVVRSAVLRPDGSVLLEPGYDPATRTLLHPLGALPEVPLEPSREDALTAAQLLAEPFREFPYATPDDRAVALAAVLTLAARPAIDGPTPAFGFSASAPGSGKTLQAVLAALIGSGHEPAVAPPADSDSEARKRLTALIVEGAPAVLWDNVVQPFGGPSLAAALTSREWQDRELGRNRTLSAPQRMVLLVTGNNLRTRSDCARRVLVSRIEVPGAHPEDRRFEREDVLAWCRARQPALLGAALTMLRAYVLAGQPRHPDPAMGSYEAWDALVRGCLRWLELGDPCGAPRARAREDGDEDLEVRRALALAWRDQFGSDPVTLRTVVTRATYGDDNPLRTALEPFSPRGSEVPSVTQLEQRLRPHLGCFVRLPADGEHPSEEGSIHKMERRDRLNVGLYRWGTGSN